MNQKTYFLAVGSLFTLITVLHALRLALGWQANIGGWDVPMWLSWVFIVVAGFMAYSGLRFGKGASQY